MELSKEITALFEDLKAEKILTASVLIYLSVLFFGIFLISLVDELNSGKLVSLVVTLLFYISIFGIVAIVIIYQISLRKWEESAIDFYRKNKEEIENEKTRCDQYLKDRIEKIENLYNEEVWKKKTSLL